MHQVLVYEAITQDLPVFLTYTGQLVPNISVSVKAQASGIIIEQYFIEGSSVKEGDLLLVIEPLPYEATLAKNKAILAQTYASLKYAQETTTRYKDLVKEDYISQLNYDQYVTNVLTNEAQIKQNIADIEIAKINLDYCYIRAPMDCVTGQLQLKPGNYIDEAYNTVLVVLNQIQPILVNFYVPETDLLQIQMKQQKAPLPLEIFLDVDQEISFPGTLSLIDNQVNSATGAILMQGTLPNADKLLWPGVFTDVRVMLEEHNSAIAVPTEAVLIGLKTPYVYIVGKDGLISMKEVKLGQRHKGLTVIASGIEEGDLVVSQGQLNVYPGLKVEIQTTAQTQ